MAGLRLSPVPGLIEPKAQVSQATHLESMLLQESDRIKGLSRIALQAGVFPLPVQRSKKTSKSKVLKLPIPRNLLVGNWLEHTRGH